MTSEAWETRMIDVVAAWYASQGDTKCQALNAMPFGKVIEILHSVPKLYPDLVARSKANRMVYGICHIDCHVKYMLSDEKGEVHDHSS
jgi:hypothetical protein